MKKLKIEQLQVKSFVTNSKDTDFGTIKGGDATDNCQSVDGCNITNTCGSTIGYHTHVAHQCSQAACYTEYCATVRTCPGHCGSVPL